MGSIGQGRTEWILQVAQLLAVTKGTWIHQKYRRQFTRGMPHKAVILTVQYHHHDNLAMTIIQFKNKEIREILEEYMINNFHNHLKHQEQVHPPFHPSFKYQLLSLSPTRDEVLKGVVEVLHGHHLLLARDQSKSWREMSHQALRRRGLPYLIGLRGEIVLRAHLMVETRQTSLSAPRKSPSYPIVPEIRYLQCRGEQLSNLVVEAPRLVLSPRLRKQIL